MHDIASIPIARNIVTIANTILLFKLITSLLALQQLLHERMPSQILLLMDGIVHGSHTS